MSLFVAYDPEGRPDVGPDRADRIAEMCGEGAVWHEGRNAIFCTPSLDRIDLRVESGEELGVVFGDAYLDGEPLTPSALRATDTDYERLDGEFLGILESDDRLRVVTDRLNVQQLFVYESEDLFVGATSVLSVLHYLADVDRLDVTLNRRTISEALNFGYPLDRKTHFEEINLLPAASVVDFEAVEGSLRRSDSTYWEMEYEDYYDDPDEAARDITDAVREAIDLRTDDEKRYGIHLSGGLDSRLILAAMPENVDVTAYSFGVPGSDEPLIARICAMASHADFEFFPLGQYLTEYAEEGVRLTDGTVTINNFHHLPSMHEMKDDVDKLFIGSIGSLLMAGSKLEPTMGTSSFGGDDVFEDVENFDEEMWNAVFDDDYFDRKVVKDSVARSYGRTSPDTSHYNRFDEWNIANRQRRHIWRGGPRSIGHFLPVSNPFTAANVLDVWLRIPPEMRMEHDFRRSMLREFDKKQAYIPETVNWTPPALNKLKYGPGGIRYLLNKRRVKRAMPFVDDEIRLGYPDYGEWLRSDRELRSFIIRKADRFSDRGWADKTAAMDMLAAHCAHEGDYWRELYSIATQEIWLEAVEEEFPALEFGSQTGSTTA